MGISHFTHAQIITKLKNEGLTINNESKVKEILNQINFFILKGYKPLISNTQGYINGATFEDLYSSYLFDKELNALLLRNSLDIELKLKTILTNIISTKYGTDDKKYLSKKNFNNTHRFYKSNINKIRKYRDVHGKKNIAMIHYKEKHKHYPFWVLSKVLTFGVLIDLYTIMKVGDRKIVADNLITLQHNFKKKVKKTTNMLTLISGLRNSCAHDEIIYNFLHRSIDIGETQVNNRYNISPFNNKNGKKDLLATIISFKYLMNHSDFFDFINSFDKIINKYVNKCKIVNRKDILSKLKLPSNFSQIKN